MSRSAVGRAAALRFLQTVVVVDDHAYTPDEDVVEEATLGDESIAEEPPPGADSPVPPDPSPDPQDFHTKVVVDAFADLGISCAVLAPDPGDYESDMERVEKLARRSDIVILDWVLNPRDRTGGTPTEDQTSLDFVRKIVRDDLTEGGRLRLICIYTGASDAAPILRQIDDALGGTVGAGALAPGVHVIDRGSTRVVVLGKDRPYTVGTIESVTSADLPERVVQEFASFVANGILREVALNSLSVVRDESNRLIRRFDGVLDPALVSHRSTTSATDAEQFARNLVGSELAAMVLTAHVTEAMSDQRVEDLVAQALAERSTTYYWKTPDAPTSKKLSPEDAAKALTLGIDRRDMILGTNQRLEPRISRTPLLLPGEEKEIRDAARSIDARFSMLSSLARDPVFEGSGSVAPDLQLGVIVSTLLAMDTSTTAADGSETEDDDGRRYWVCLQPLCDSVRLHGPTPFPMLPLRPGRASFNYVVAQDGDFLPLEHAGSKVSELELVRFEPDPSSLTVPARWNGENWTFTSSSDQVYTWKGSLRLDKAHRLLQSVVTVAGRIGIDEYEYLRRAAR